jgi:hypothetical protein
MCIILNFQCRGQAFNLHLINKEHEDVIEAEVFILIQQTFLTRCAFQQKIRTIRPWTISKYEDVIEAKELILIQQIFLKRSAF